MTKENLIDGILKTLRNAQELCDESEILFKNGKFARSYSLSHLAREEFSKCFILYRPIVELIRGNQIDWKKTRTRYRSHKEKLIADRATTLHLFGNELEKNGIKKKELFSGIEKSNEWKNTSLYVDWSNDKFIMPADSFSKEKAERNLEIAIYRIRVFTPIFTELIQITPEVEKKIKENYTNGKLEQMIKECCDDIFKE
jgi:AbiV family abortive infection protein